LRISSGKHDDITAKKAEGTPRKQGYPGVRQRVVSTWFAGDY